MAKEIIEITLPEVAIRDTPLKKEEPELSDQIANTAIRMLKSYSYLHMKAKDGEKVTAEDFNRVDTLYNKMIGAVADKVDDIIAKDPTKEKYVEESREKAQKKVENWLAEHPYVLGDINDIKPLDEVFRKQYLANAPSKNLSISSDTITPPQLMSELLAKNPGIAIGDAHTNSTSFPLISNNIATLKKSGVDTIYLEMGPQEFSEMNKLSVSELKKSLEARTPEIIEKEAREYAQSYGKELSNGSKIHDAAGDKLRLFLAAKENGIDIINIDKKGPARDAEGDLSEIHRIASSNFTFSENIINDRKNKPKDGKYVVLSGIGHFGAATQDSRGLIDERLGIPVIMFDNRDGNTKSPILKGEGHNGADFYIPGEKCHPDTKKLAKAADFEEQTQSPDINSSEETTLKFLARQYRSEFSKELKMQCTPASEGDLKIPTSVHSSQPSSEVQGKH